MPPKPLAGPKPTKHFFEFVKSIGESKSKQEEDRIISQEVQILKEAFKERVSNREMREMLIRMVYCEMLGYDASFGHIHAIKMTQQHQVFDKKIGYLACTLLLHEEHQLMILLINTIRNDLRDSNTLTQCTALSAICKLLNAEMIPVVLPQVLDLCRSSKNEFVRKKALMCVEKLFTQSPESMNKVMEFARSGMCDRDPSVMSAALCLLLDLVEKNPRPFKDLVSSLVSILKQVIEHKLHVEYEYHRMPAPWIQINLLRILAALGADDKDSSEGMYEILNEVMKRADSGINIGHAVIYECVRTIASIYPSGPLLETAASSIARFITSENHNLKYLGIRALTQIVQIDPKYVGNHQMIIIDCLEDPDETLKRKTLDLLFRIGNENNVELVASKLLSAISSITTAENTDDEDYKKELITKITLLAEKYAPSNTWYVDTINQTFEAGGNLVPTTVCDNLLQLLCEGSGEDEELDEELREYALTTYMDALEKDVVSDPFTRVMAWVVGEYGPDLDDFDADYVLQKLCTLMDRTYEYPDTRHTIITSVMKICSRIEGIPECVSSIVEKYMFSRDVELQQRCSEFSVLVGAPETLEDILPPRGATEDLEIDVNLSFLNGFVDAARQRGLPDWIPEDERDDPTLLTASLLQQAKKRGGNNAEDLHFEAYPVPQGPSAASFDSIRARQEQEEEREQTEIAIKTTVQSHINMERITSSRNTKWGPKGYNDRNAVSKVSAPYEEKDESPPPSYSASAPLASSIHISTPASQAPLSHLAMREEEDSTIKILEEEKPEQQIELPVYISDREKLAAQLFNTGASSSVSSAPRSRMKKPTRRSTTTRQQQQQHQHQQPTTTIQPEPASLINFPSSSPSTGGSDVLDFGGMMTMSSTATQPAPSSDLLPGFSTTIASTPQTTAPPPSDSSLLDFSMLSVSAPSQTQAPQQTLIQPPPPPPPTTASADIMSLFFDATQPSSSSSSSSSSSASSSSSSFSSPQISTTPSSSMSSSFSTSASSQQNAFASFSSQIPAAKRSHQSPVPLSLSTSSLALFYAVAYTATSSDLWLFLSNKSGMLLENITLRYDKMINSISVEAMKCTNVSAATNPTECHIQQLPPDCTAVIILSCQYPVTSEFKPLKLSLSNGGELVNVPDIPMSVKDFLRPSAIDTAQFGGLWKQNPVEVSFNLNTKTITNPRAFMEIAAQSNFQQVEIRGIQCITAAGPVRTGYKCLLHGKVNPDGVLNIKVRSKQETFSRAVADYARNAFNR